MRRLRKFLRNLLMLTTPQLQHFETYTRQQLEANKQQFETHAQQITDNVQQFETMETKMRYLMNEVSDLRALVRYLLPDSAAYQRFMQQTSASFDYQWKNLSTGSLLLSDEQFKKEIFATLEAYTCLPQSWFAGKKVLDAGCGNGRWSWAFCASGAQVTAVDFSPAGVAAAREACREFSNFQAKQHNLLESLEMPEAFDLVWCYGVTHHTGNTHLALQNVAECVKLGGYLFLHIYGEPRWDQPIDFAEVNKYISLRRELAALSFDERVTYLREHEDETYLHTWFDAASPKINDLHRFDEIAEWLHLLGFTDIQRTMETMNHHIIARRRS